MFHPTICLSSPLTFSQHQNANTRLAPGDMVSVDPKAIRFLQPTPAQVESEAENETEAEENFQEYNSPKPEASPLDFSLSPNNSPLKLLIIFPGKEIKEFENPYAKTIEVVEKSKKKVSKRRRGRRG